MVYRRPLAAPARGMRPFSTTFALLLVVVTLVTMVKNAVRGVHVHKFSDNPRLKNMLIPHHTPMGGLTRAQDEHTARYDRGFNFRNRAIFPPTKRKDTLTLTECTSWV